MSKRIYNPHDLLWFCARRCYRALVAACEMHDALNVDTMTVEEQVDMDEAYGVLVLAYENLYAHVDVFQNKAGTMSIEEVNEVAQDAVARELEHHRSNPGDFPSVSGILTGAQNDLPETESVAQ